MCLLSYLVNEGVQNLPIVALWCSMCHSLMWDVVDVAMLQPSGQIKNVIVTRNGFGLYAT